jgi:membrane-bound ClpP family serine protease
VCLETADVGGDGEPTKERTMSIGTILIVVLVLMLVGVLPVWPHASSWGYGPSGIVGVILVVLIVLFLMGRL